MLGGKELFDLSPDHETDDLVLIQFSCYLRLNGPTVAHHRYPLTNFENLFQAVGDIDDGHVLLFQPANQIK